MNWLNSLVTRFVTGSVLLFLGVLLLGYVHQQSLQLQTDLSRWQGQADILVMHTNQLQALAQHYKTNAPRDYESYERDLQVFYGQFSGHLALISADQDLIRDYEQVISHNPLMPWLMRVSALTGNQETSQQAVATPNFWNGFATQMQETLGDPQEPRLEWASELVLEQFPLLQASVEAQQARAKAATALFNASSQQLNYLVVALVSAFILAGFIAFSFKVIRPVLRTARACQQVAAGDYGLHVPLDGSGETRQLQQAFNELSSRAALMLDLVGDLNRHESVPARLAAILDNSREALGVNWIGLMHLETDSARLQASVPAAIDYDWKHRQLSLNKSLGKRFNDTGAHQWLDLSNLAELALRHHDERFLRELHKNTMASQVMGYGFTCPRQHRFLLMFSTRHKEGFNAQQQSLMQTLAHLMVNSIIDSMPADPAPSNVQPLTLKAL